MADRILEFARKPSYGYPWFHLSGGLFGQDNSFGDMLTEDWFIGNRLNTNQFNDRALGLFTTADGVRVNRVNSGTGFGNPDDAIGYGSWSSRMYLYNRTSPISIPVGFYFRTLARIENLNRPSIVEAFLGWGIHGTLATDKSPLIAFRVVGAGNWFARVQDDASAGAITEDTDLGIDTLAVALLEIVVIPGQVRFYIDQALLHTSTVIFPPTTAAKVADSFQRRITCFIGGDNINDTALRFWGTSFHAFSTADLPT